MIPAVSFMGWSNSGKTTFLEKVITLLKEQGFHVAVVKNTHQRVEFDISGKDTWKFAQAGADTVILNGPEQFISQEKVTSRKDAAEVLQQIAGVDIVLFEGARDSFLPKVEVWREDSGEGFKASPEEIIALITGSAEKFEGPFGQVERFCPDQVGEFVAFLLKWTGLEKK